MPPIPPRDRWRVLLRAARAARAVNRATGFAARRAAGEAFAHAVPRPGGASLRRLARACLVCLDARGLIAADLGAAEAAWAAVDALALERAPADRRLAS